MRCADPALRVGILVPGADSFLDTDGEPLEPAAAATPVSVRGRQIGAIVRRRHCALAKHPRHGQNRALGRLHHRFVGAFGRLLEGTRERAGVNDVLAGETFAEAANDLR